MSKYALTVTCKSTRGIVAGISGFLAEQGCHITDSAQFDDAETGNFFMRISFSPEEDVAVSPDGLTETFGEIAKRFGMTYHFFSETERMKVIVMVSRFGHCLNDLLYRCRIGALPVEIVAVISNHMDYQKVVVNHDIPFHCIKVTKENKPQAERRIMEVVEETGAELVVLARYMQILSDEMCQKMSGRIINIHHSFLPSFKGANPYKQAFERGGEAHRRDLALRDRRSRRRPDHRAGHGAGHPCAKPVRLCLSGPRNPRAYPPPRFPERQQDGGVPGLARFLRLRAYGLSAAPAAPVLSICGKMKARARGPGKCAMLDPVCGGVEKPVHMIESLDI